MQRPQFPTFTREAALAKMQAAESAWNIQNPEEVVQASSMDYEELFQSRAAVELHLKSKWADVLHYRLVKEFWAYTNNRISVQCEYEWQHAENGQWYRSNSINHWELNADGYKTRSEMDANDIPIALIERRIGIVNNQQ